MYRKRSMAKAFLACFSLFSWNSPLEKQATVCPADTRLGNGSSKHLFLVSCSKCAYPDWWVWPHFLFYALKPQSEAKDHPDNNISRLYPLHCSVLMKHKLIWKASLYSLHQKKYWLGMFSSYFSSKYLFVWSTISIHKGCLTQPYTWYIYG